VHEHLYLIKIHTHREGPTGFERVGILVITESDVIAINTTNLNRNAADKPSELKGHDRRIPSATSNQ
jgi:hypothetical protein